MDRAHTPLSLAVTAKVPVFAKALSAQGQRHDIQWKHNCAGAGQSASSSVATRHHVGIKWKYGRNAAVKPGIGCPHQLLRYEYDYEYKEMVWSQYPIPVLMHPY